LNSFRNVLRLNLCYAIEIGNGACQLQNAIVRTRAKALLLHGALQQSLAVAGEFAVGADLARTHLRIGVNALSGGGKAVELHLASVKHAIANGR
jgi:hypothetical protein